MDPVTKEQLLAFYNLHYKKFGERPEALRWTPQGAVFPVKEVGKSFHHFPGHSQEEKTEVG